MLLFKLTQFDLSELTSTSEHFNSTSSQSKMASKKQVRMRYKPSTTKIKRPSVAQVAVTNVANVRRSFVITQRNKPTLPQHRPIRINYSGPNRPDPGGGLRVLLQETPQDVLEQTRPSLHPEGARGPDHQAAQVLPDSHGGFVQGAPQSHQRSGVFELMDKCGDLMAPCSKGSRCWRK